MEKKEGEDVGRSHEFELFGELVELIEAGKRQLVQQANRSVNITFWHVGKKINDYILNNRRAEYGKQIVATLARQLSEQYGRNFEEKNLRRIMQFANEFPNLEIVVPLARQLSWSRAGRIIRNA